MQFGERCHWLEAERITHKYDPRWGTGVWLGRHSASDVHLIGTPGGVIQVTTVRRLTRAQRGDDVSKRALDNIISGSPRNLSGSKPSLEEQTAHGEKWTLTPGCKGSRGYHHTKACKARKREFLMTNARSEQLRAAEADAWRKPASATEPPRSARPSGSAGEDGAQREPVDEQPQPQPDVGDSDMAAGTETPDAETTQRTRIVTKRSDPAVPTEGVPKKMRIWSKHSPPLTPQSCQNCRRNVQACFGEPRDICNDARIRRQLGDVHRVECCSAGFARTRSQRRCSQVTGDGYPSQSCRRPARKRSRNCSNLKRTKRSHRPRLRGSKPSVHGLSTNGKKVEN